MTAPQFKLKTMSVSWRVTDGIFRHLRSVPFFFVFPEEQRKNRDFRQDFRGMFEIFITMWYNSIIKWLVTEKYTGVSHTFYLSRSSSGNTAGMKCEEECYEEIKRRYADYERKTDRIRF